jgi:hypothetical protein
MTKHFDFTPHVSTIPDFWLDNLQEFISTLAPNFKLEVVQPASVRLYAGPDNDLVALGISGRWRYVTATVTAAHPGGAAGTYDLWATATDNDFSGGQPNPDLTVYSFGLVVRPQGYVWQAGDPPLRRRVATLDWSGTAIAALAQLVGVTPGFVGYGPGICLDFFGDERDAPPRTTTCDGHQLSKTSEPGLWNKLSRNDTAASPWDTFGGLPAPSAGSFRVPDLRGRGTVGKLDMGGPTGTAPPTLTGVAITRAAATTLGALLGEEYHVLAVAEMPSHNHGGATGTQSADHTHTGTTGTESADHSHGGNTGYQSTGHSHAMGGYVIVMASTAQGVSGGGGDGVFGGTQTGDISANHYHGFTTGGRSAAHTHSFTSSGASVSHTHTITAQGGGGGHENVHPVAVVNKLVTL